MISVLLATLALCCTSLSALPLQETERVENNSSALQSPLSTDEIIRIEQAVAALRVQTIIRLQTPLEKMKVSVAKINALQVQLHEKVETKMHTLKRVKRQTANSFQQFGNLFLELNTMISQVSDQNSQMNVGLREVGEAVGMMTLGFDKIFGLFANNDWLNPVKWFEALTYLGDQMALGFQKFGEAAEDLVRAIDSLLSFGKDTVALINPDFATTTLAP